MSDKQKIIDLENRIHRLNEIGMALSTESDSNKLFEMILEVLKFYMKNLSIYLRINIH